MGIKTKGLNDEGVISIIFTRETTLPQLMQAEARRPIVLAIEPGSEGGFRRRRRAAAGSARWLQAPAGFQPQRHGDAASERRVYEATAGRRPIKLVVETASS